VSSGTDVSLSVPFNTDIDGDVSSAADPATALETLAVSQDPYFIGVRHHSPALAAAMPALLSGFRPDVLLIELPTQAAPWLGHLADEETFAPVALAGAAGDGGVAFYPFADFSPELAALRWARENGVLVVPCDLPLSAIAGSWETPERDAHDPRYAEALQSSGTGRASDDLWDRQVEARAPGSSPEQIRRAALAVGWALRADAGMAQPRDLAREAWMRGVLRGEAVAGRRVAMLLGAFHIPAMTSADKADAPDEVVEAALKEDDAESMSLVPYNFKLLDERSGYPSGIRDPHWQQSVYESCGVPEEVRAAAAAHLVEVCRALREAGHPAGPAEAGQALRFALDLATLRGLAAPARGELVESVQAVLGHGDSLGRGRVLGRALELALVGDRLGRLAPGTPVSGLRVAVQSLLAELRLPGPGDASREVRLDPLRSALDRRREVTLRRLAVCRVPYATERELVAPGGLPPLTTAWRAAWTPTTEANLNILTARGLSLAQAAASTLRQQMRDQHAADGPTAAETLAGMRAAAECGVPDMLGERVLEIGRVVIATASLAELIDAARLTDRIRAGHVPGTPAEQAADLIPADLGERLDAAALRHLDGLGGSQDLADARALTAFTLRVNESGGVLRADQALGRLEREGAPMISAAAGACLVLTGAAAPQALGERIAGWIDSATYRAARSSLRERLRGLLSAAGPILNTGPLIIEALVRRINTLADADFLERLVALRGGFAEVTPAERDRILRTIEELIGGLVDSGRRDGLAPRLLADAASADAAGRSALLAAGLPLPAGYASVIAASDSTAAKAFDVAPTPAEPVGVLTPADRWRLILGREQDRCSGQAQRYGRALDELYGSGAGSTGSRSGPGRSGGQGGGRESAYPSIREWSADLESLFGKGIREEVLAAAAATGRLDAALELDPAAVTPSVELLRNVLSLAGNLPEAALARLRPLVKRLIDDLAKQLANRLRPALHGLTSPRPTPRPGGRLDFDRTVRANLATARREPDGRVTLLPERPVFHSRVRKTADWRLILVVDVSGSMESSVIWSALTASVFAGVSTLQTHFLAFSTEVVDFTDRVSDPLSLLLEVSVGGGTHIAAGLAHARSLMTVPARTLIVTISDFEEGYPVGGLLAEVRKLADSGATLLGCASLDDNGTPRYSAPIAAAVAAAGMPVAALSPLELAAWVGEKIR